jgi:hypothetical protein
VDANNDLSRPRIDSSDAGLVGQSDPEKAVCESERFWAASDRDRLDAPMNPVNARHGPVSLVARPKKPAANGRVRGRIANGNLG